MHELPIERANTSEYTAAKQDEVAYDRVEYGLHIRRQAGNDAQYLCCRPLLPPRLGELTGARLKLLLELARVGLELLFQCRLRVLRRVKMTHAGRPKLRIRRTE